MKRLLGIALGVLTTFSAFGEMNHTIEKGDNLYRISERYSVNFEELLKVNNLTINSVLQLGQKVIIPEGAVDTKQLVIEAPEPLVFDPDYSAAPLTQRDIRRNAAYELRQMELKLDGVCEKIREVYSDDKEFLKRFDQAQTVWKKMLEADMHMRFPKMDNPHAYGSSFGSSYAKVKMAYVEERIHYVARWLIGGVEGNIANGSIGTDYALRKSYGTFNIFQKLTVPDFAQRYLKRFRGGIEISHGAYPSSENSQIQMLMYHPWSITLDMNGDGIDDWGGLVTIADKGLHYMIIYSSGRTYRHFALEADFCHDREGNIVGYMDVAPKGEVIEYMEGDESLSSLKLEYPAIETTADEAKGGYLFYFENGTLKHLYLGC